VNPVELLDGLKKDVDRNSSTVNSLFAGLSAAQLNWKPSPEKWSIAQCIDHLNVYDRLYLIRFRRILISGRKNLLSRDHYKPSLLGNYFIRQVDPRQSSQTFTAPAVFQPGQSDVPTGVLSEFTRLQHLLWEMLEKAKRYDLKRNKVPTPVTELVRLRIGDAFIVVVRHDQRHILQAQRVLDHENFPK
jgi:hypothetical protein